VKDRVAGQTPRDALQYGQRSE